MKAYQIVMVGDERSEEYAEISRKSFKPALDKGIIEEIITFPAITPESPDFEEHVNKYTWHSSLMLADISDRGGKNKDDHSPTEKAGMCSHWELMRRQSESEEMFFVMEHDTYLTDIDMFEKLVAKIENSDIMYANIGLFMGCYTFKPEVAKWQYDMLTKDFPINCGPYCTLQRLFATYTTSVLRPNNYFGVDPTVIHPYHDLSTLHFGRNVQKPFNGVDPDPDNNPWKNPTTQVVSKRLAVTQDHHSYNEEHIKHPWKRSTKFHVID
jgi:hypothetical protein